jgi:hypothetical protein
MFFVVVSTEQENLAFVGSRNATEFRSTYAVIVTNDFGEGRARFDIERLQYVIIAFEGF